MSQHEAGRELDALVAEHVMEFDPVEWSGDDLVYGDQKTGDIVPRYSTDFTAAWQVIGRMEEKGWQWSLDGTSGPFYVKFDKPGVPPHIGSANTAPHAICLAALKAVEVSR